ncbi:ribosome biogenesis GTP-binding protein YihA/YsxC [Mycoplasmopsis verecunda]|uniref:Probable GTP-binding protein EngB n=1 Tax=Mycoplasmopsis verecunda TaxID=171291 RepID=A0A1T4KVA7_9BACT|nr:ribosome biogenesis GTP-binding protein YihA/YsxC [Mycoplasmopsis verecunda]WPB54629.1 ribosome biogenesis GTP-binding protein YihA/YsxC [Mycoplasmopsis verecunda]SJZ46336.1 GTP-binding protein [Mycoplasmopsis verecunda]
MFKFIKSASNKENWYEHPYNEVAFWGRSNVGKSSLINAIVSNKKLAKVSKTPGRTQLLNFFQNDFGAVFVDLPGYGYARVSNAQLVEMNKMIDEYIINRNNLKCVYLLIDSRHGITKTDIEPIEFLLRVGVDFKLVYTKADKLKQKDKHKLVQDIKKSREIYGPFQYFLVSSETKTGINDLILDINETLSGEHNE